MDFTYDIYSIGIVTAIISFLGFCFEDIWLAFTKGYIDNRNMRFPFLMGYGLFVVAFYLVLGSPTTFSEKLALSAGWSLRMGRLVYFILAMIIVSVGELLLGEFTEKVCHMTYWNYSWIPLHITKYTSIPTSFGFAIVICFFEEHCFMPLMHLADKIPFYIRAPLSVILFVTMFVDMMCGFWAMKKKEGLNEIWRIRLDKKKNTHE